MQVSEQVHREVSTMVDCLLLVSMADRYFIAFEQDIKDSKYHKQYVKRILPLCASTIAKEHGRAFEIFKHAGGNVSYGYMAACDDVDDNMDSHILLVGLERSSTILQTIAEMIEDRISGITEVDTAGFDTVCKVIRRFSPHIPMQSNKAIRFIIEEALKKRLLNNTNY